VGFFMPVIFFFKKKRQKIAGNRRMNRKNARHQKVLF
jgi:hypothetical protein